MTGRSMLHQIVMTSTLTSVIKLNVDTELFK